MAATIHRFRSRRDKLRVADAVRLRQMVLDFGDDLDLAEGAIGRVVAAVDGQTASENGWTFVMIGPRENQAVVDWLRENSRRPQAAMAVWAMLFTSMRTDTGDILWSRAEIAEHVGIASDNVSRIMTELVGIGAVSRRRVGRSVRYRMNPVIGTKLGGQVRDKAQAAAAGQLQLELVESGG